MATLIHNPRTGPLLTGEAISFFAARSLDLPDRDVVETREVQVVADERACQLLELVEVVVELELAHDGVQVGENLLGWATGPGRAERHRAPDRKATLLEK